eukprot:7378198-Prymnesium_polylepis.1
MALSPMALRPIALSPMASRPAAAGARGGRLWQRAVHADGAQRRRGRRRHLSGQAAARRQRDHRRCAHRQRAHPRPTHARRPAHVHTSSRAAEAAMCRRHVESFLGSAILLRREHPFTARGLRSPTCRSPTCTPLTHSSAPPPRPARRAAVHHPSVHLPGRQLVGQAAGLLAAQHGARRGRRLAALALCGQHLLRGNSCLLKGAVAAGTWWDDK